LIIVVSSSSSSFISEKAGIGTLNASITTAATIIDMEYFAFTVRSSFIVVTVAF
jgi:hypothetical protein